MAKSDKPAAVAGKSMQVVWVRGRRVTRPIVAPVKAGG